MDQLKIKNLVFLVIILVLLATSLVILWITKPMPVALAREYDLSMLWHEGTIMNECADCHSSADFHTCDTCHDDHGAVKLSGVRFFEVVELTGDVPDPSFVRVNEVLPDQENRGTHITLFDFLEEKGIKTFESVTFTTNDGGLTTIKSEYLDETAMLVPYIDGVRFVTESVHSSTWLKGISKITVVSKEKPLTIEGEATSIGRLLVGETIRLTVEGSDTMLTDETGETSRAYVANWVDGARLLPLLEDTAVKRIKVIDASGEITELSGEEIEEAIIALVRDKVTLVLPDRGRSAWPTDIVSIASE